jgi:hypothetical protein
LQIVIWSSTFGVEEELARGALGNIKVYRGPNSQSVQISGNSTVTASATPPRRAYRIDKLLYTYSDSEGRARWRIEPRAILRPGDTVRYGNTFLEIDSITWSVSDGGTTMELATVPPSGELDPE